LKELKFTDGTYKTGRHHTSALAKISPSFALYSRVVPIVSIAALKAKRGMYDDQEWAKSSLEILNALEGVGIKFDISGIENIKNLTDPCVFIGNHMSTLETFVLPSLIRPFKPVTFIVKQGLVEYPIFGHVMRSRNPITVGRTNPRDDLKAVLEGGAERLKAGISIIVFPQTTRILDFDPKEFNTIGIKLAKKAGAPIIPIALKTDAWENGKRLKDFGRIDPSKTAHIAFGEVMHIKDRGTEEHERIIEFITSKLSVWGKL
jgi:1-acyl-sn-glycerol-3-phosphate acyltransferase